MGAQGLGRQGESLLCEDAFTAPARRMSCMLATMYICLSDSLRYAAVACRADQVEAGWIEQLNKEQNSWLAAEQEM